MVISKSIPWILDIHSTVNVDSARDEGSALLAGMEGKTVAERIFKRNDQAVTLDTKSAVKIDGATVQIDPQLLFQWLTVAAKAIDNLEAVFKYERCSYPPALFDSSLFPEALLANAIWALLTPNIPGITGDTQYVLDGGALLQRIPWTHGATYKDICTVYRAYVAKKYWKAIVVFDGYGERSMKDMTHQRQSIGQTGVTVSFTEEMQLTMKKTNFLVTLPTNSYSSACLVTS